MSSIYKSILLIEDDKDDQQFFSEVMKNFESLVLNIASNGPDGISVITANAMPDIIFLDLNMPMMNGKEFIRTVRENNIYNGPIVILSTSSSQKDIAECKMLGVSNFLTKPGSFSELTKMISSILMGE